MSSMVRTIERKYFRPRSPKFDLISRSIEKPEMLNWFQKLWKRIARWFV